MSNMQPFELYGSSFWMHPDTYIMTTAERDRHFETARKKIHGVSPESIALRRLQHPEEFYDHRKNDPQLSLFTNLQ